MVSLSEDARLLILFLTPLLGFLAGWKLAPNAGSSEWDKIHENWFQTKVK